MKSYQKQLDFNRRRRGYPFSAFAHTGTLFFDFAAVFDFL